MDEDSVRDPLLASTSKIMLGDRREEDEEEQAGAMLISKSTSPLRWPVLVLACLMLIGSYYCFDIPSALKTQINDYMQDPAKDYETDFALLYTLYAAPNIILPFFGGYFVDRFGVCICLLVFTSLIAVGQVVVTLGFLFKSWPLIFFGRFIFALGGENLIVANSALLADWFKGKELAFSFGVNLSIARVGSVVNNILSPSLTHSVGLIFSLWFGAMTCAASVLCVVLTIPIDRRLDLEIAAQAQRGDSRLLSRSRSNSSSSGSGSGLGLSRGRSGVSINSSDGGDGRHLSPSGSGLDGGALLGFISVPRWLNPWAAPTGERSPLSPHSGSGSGSGSGSVSGSGSGSGVVGGMGSGGVTSAPLGEEAVSPLFRSNAAANATGAGAGTGAGTGSSGSGSGSGSSRGVSASASGTKLAESQSLSLHHRGSDAALAAEREREKLLLGAGAGAGVGVGAGVSAGGAALGVAGADPSSAGSGSGSGSGSAAPSIQYRDVLTLPGVFWVLVALCVAMYGSVLPFNNIASSLLLERNYFIAPQPPCRLQFAGQCQSDPGNLPVNCTDLQFAYYQPPLPVDILVDGLELCHGPADGDLGPQCIASDVDCTSSQWYSESGSPPGCAQEYCSRQIDAIKSAAWVMSIPYTISGVVSPIIGLLIDKYGLRAVIATIAAALIIVVHVALGYTSVSPVGPLVGQGLAYTGFAAVLWPAIPLVVQPRLTGLAFGIVTSALNAGCAVLPLVVAKVKNDAGGLYIPSVELLFALLGVLALALGLYLNYYDATHGHELNRGEAPKGGWKDKGKDEDEDEGEGRGGGGGGGGGGDGASAAATAAAARRGSKAKYVLVGQADDKP